MTLKRRVEKLEQKGQAGQPVIQVCWGDCASCEHKSTCDPSDPNIVRVHLYWSNDDSEQHRT